MPSNTFYVSDLTIHGMLCVPLILSGNILLNMGPKYAVCNQFIQVNYMQKFGMYVSEHSTVQSFGIPRYTKVMKAYL